MSTQTYEQLIINGIRGLPPEVLAEIADYVYFLRKRIVDPEAFEAERKSVLLNAELKQLSIREVAHLESEIEGYERRYPREYVCRRHSRFYSTS